MDLFRERKSLINQAFQTIVVERWIRTIESETTDLQSAFGLRYPISLRCGKNKIYITLHQTVLWISGAEAHVTLVRGDSPVRDGSSMSAECPRIDHPLTYNRTVPRQDHRQIFDLQKRPGGASLLFYRFLSQNALSLMCFQELPTDLAFHDCRNHPAVYLLISSSVYRAYTAEGLSQEYRQHHFLPCQNFFRLHIPHVRTPLISSDLRFGLLLLNYDYVLACL